MFQERINGDSEVANLRAGEENNQDSSDNPGDEARKDVSQDLNLLSNISCLKGIKTSDHHRDGAPGEQDDWDDLSSFLWQTVVVTVTENLLLLPGNVDMRSKL